MSAQASSAGGDFIEVYPGALSAELCARAITQFEQSGLATRGAMGSGVDIALKDSWDLCISNRPEFAWLKLAIESAALTATLHYLRRYPYTLLAPLAFKRQDPATGALHAISAEDLRAFSDAQLIALLRRAFRPGTINLQRYLADQGGYPYWHCEHYPKAGDAEPLARVLLYSVYLNDAFEAGETEFQHQGRLIRPQTGALLLAPAFFTHTHRGNRPQGGDKYIATSWILFQHPEQLFAPPPPSG